MPNKPTPKFYEIFIYKNFSYRACIACVSITIALLSFAQFIPSNLVGFKKWNIFVKLATPNAVDSQTANTLAYTRTHRFSYAHAYSHQLMQLMATYHFYALLWDLIRTTANSRRQLPQHWALVYQCLIR